MSRPQRDPCEVCSLALVSGVLSRTAAEALCFGRTPGFGSVAPLEPGRPRGLQHGCRRVVSVSEEYAKAVGARLRSIRQQQELTLHGVEERSNGSLKAVRVGSYERGDRGITAAQLQELAEFYRVPVTELLPDRTPVPVPADSTRLVIDRQRLAELRAEPADELRRFVAAIQAQRGDYNGRVLTLRDADLRTLSLLYRMPETVLRDEFDAWGVLYSDPDPAVPGSE